MLLAPRHQLVASEARVSADPDVDVGPATPDGVDDAGDLVGDARTTVDVGPAQLGDEREVIPEDVERQVAVGPVVAVEEPTFLAAVDTGIRGVGIEDDALRRLVEAVQPKLDEQVGDPLLHRRDPMVPMAGRPSLGAVLEPVQRRGGGARRALLLLADEGRKQWVAAQCVVVVEVLVPGHQAEDALRKQLRECVGDAAWVAVIPKARRQALEEPQSAGDLTHQDQAAVRRDLAAVKAALELPAPHPLESQPQVDTTCSQGSSLVESVFGVATFTYNGLGPSSRWGGELSGLVRTG